MFEWKNKKHCGIFGYKYMAMTSSFSQTISTFDHRWGDLGGIGDK